MKLVGCKHWLWGVLLTLHLFLLSYDLDTKVCGPVIKSMGDVKEVAVV